MSEVQNTAPAAAAETTPVVEPSTTAQQPETTVEETPKTDAATTATETPAAESAKPAESEEVSAVKDEAAPAEEKKDEVAAVPEKKPAEPITEGQLAVKGPGLLKSIIPSKKEFWLSDDAVSTQALSSYMRGEKSEIAYPVAAWASQTGKGLLFFNKKGETNKKAPSHVLPLYDATDLKKESPHELSFKLHGQEHVLKATSDAERDGWYLSIEKAIEIGKAQREEIRDSEGYKAEMEKLNKPIVSVAAAAATPVKSQPKKSMDADKTDDAAAAERKNSDVVEEEKKDKKSRSTSRGVLNRLKGKKEEAEVKKEEKKEEKKTEEEPKPEESKTEEIVGGTAVAGTAAAGAAVVAGSSEEDKKEETTETAVETKTEEKPKPQKRGSIFGKMQGWGSMKSPSKEKDQKDAELKPEVPPKDGAVAETAPQIPETTTTTEAAEEPAVVATEDEAKTETKPETAEKKEGITPGKEKSAFLSGLPFMNKRNRSVSPSTNMKEAPAKTEEAAPSEVPKEAEPVEEGKTDEAIAETTAVEPLKPEEPAKADTTPNKRQSVLGNLGRRASKAFKGMQAPKKENVTPTAEAKKEETIDAPKTTEVPSTNGETKAAEPALQQIGDVVPEAINVGKPENQAPAVAASA